MLDNGFMDDSELELNINEILRDFYDVNKFLNISYIIFNNPNTNNTKVNYWTLAFIMKK